jgi:sugar phosphate isomerase/epimerase
MIRLGGPIFGETSDPETWVEALRAEGYSAAFCPVNADADDEVVRAYALAAEKAGVVIAEVGAWSNPVSPDDATRKAALEHCKAQLHLADRIGARCCVNITGSMSEVWDAPHADNLTDETFDRVVASVREIIDAVQPSRTFYTLETMPWMYPDSVESYARLIAAIDRPALAVHFDPVNLICSPRSYFGNAALIREFVAKLGPSIKSCHAKDTLLAHTLTTHLDEVRPGLGNLDYATYLTEIDRLNADTPIMIEHLATQEDYRTAAAHIRSVAKSVGVRLA